MPRFALLVRESANRVYAGESQRLLAAELGAIAPALHGGADDRTALALGGVPYVAFTSGGLDDHDRFVVSNLSTARAVFELRDDGTLVPIDLALLECFDSDLITIQKYPGKTNEQFTHLLVNLTVAASRAAHERAAAGERVRLLDPVAGRGTTLNRALVYGFDATGVELTDADVDQYRVFLVTYLKEHRIKHKATQARVRKGDLAGTSSFEVAIRGSQQVRMVRGESERAPDLLAGQKFDVVVGDLPYGVQHRAAAARTSARSPADLLDAAIDGWRSVMRGGAAVGLSWNTRTMPREQVVARLSAAGLDVVEHPASFEHVVDRSIRRDLVVATR